MSTSAEQIARFIKAHPGEWQSAPDGRPGWVLPIAGDWHVWLYEDAGWIAVQLVDPRYPTCPVPWRWPEANHDMPDMLDILARVALRAADAMPYGDELWGDSADTLPPWLADPVRQILRTRAGELLTLAGSSPADVVSAAETLDEALCARAPVAPTFDGVVNALQAIGMSCRWIGGDPLILVGDHVYIRDDLPSVPIDDFAAFTEKHGERRMVKGDKSGAPAVPGYRVFMALAPVTP